jgi:molecular chaperone DnaJ
VNLLKNYYKILKVATNATDQDIKTAYLKLAKKYHPDKNQNSTDAVKLFQEINEAYEVLSNTRQAYDNQTPHLNKIQQSVLDVEVSVTVKNFKDLTINYQAYRGCKKCDHTGFNVQTDAFKCKKCDGNGYDKFDKECVKCCGTGKVYDTLCPHCKGSKFMLTPLSVTIENLKLFQDKDKIVFTNRGHRDAKNTKNGNLIVHLKWPDKM